MKPVIVLSQTHQNTRLCTYTVFAQPQTGNGTERNGNETRLGHAAIQSTGNQTHGDRNGTCTKAYKPETDPWRDRNTGHMANRAGQTTKAVSSSSLVDQFIWISAFSTWCTKGRIVLIILKMKYIGKSVTSYITYIQIFNYYCSLSICYSPRERD